MKGMLIIMPFGTSVLTAHTDFVLSYANGKISCKTWRISK